MSQETAQTYDVITESQLDFDEIFADDVRKGLLAEQKSLPCVYFYDARGSQLFEQICSLPEYYPTRTEAEILKNHAKEIAVHFPPNTKIVELGSGSSVKTRYLLEAFLNRYGKAEYIPIDVSQTILEESAENLEMAYPNLTVNPITALYEDGFSLLDKTDNAPHLVLWLGSSIGNFTKSEAIHFLKRLTSNLSGDDQLLIGMDLIKSRHILEAAYDDTAGVTAEFNLNLLTRINRELGGNFKLNNFRHQAIFNSSEGRVEMYLKSTKKQSVFIDALELEVTFDEDERIHTENAHKFSLDDINNLASALNLNIRHQWFDDKKWFSLNLLSTK